MPLYKRYVSLKQRIKTHPRFAGIQHAGQLVERYAVYVILIVLGTFVVGNNLLARTIRPDEIGVGAPWTSFVSNEASDLIVETTPAQPIAAIKTDRLVVGGMTGQPAAIAATVTPSAPVVSPVLVDAVGGPPPGGTDSDAAARQETVTYTVQGGDTLSTIAHRFGLTSKTVLWANGLDDADFIKPGQTLKIPPAEGYLYTVKQGDTLAAITKKYGGNQDDVLTANRLATADALQPGQEILIPGGEPPAPSAPVPSARRTLLTQVFAGSDSGAAPPSAPATGARFIWPTTGRKINQYFRGRFHTGIDVEGTYSTPIYAASSGRVIFSAFDRSGYGLHVVIDHGNGYETLYAHASKVFVGVGDRVKQGQTIAMVGSTGRSTGSHLHFEIRVGGGFLNPLSFF